MCEARMDLLEFPSTEAEFRTRFVDERPCREYLARLKWPEGFRCAHCGGDAAYFLPSKRVVYECIGCRRQVSVIAGTIFEQSKKALALWFRAIFEVTASKQGISAAELCSASSGSAVIRQHGHGCRRSAAPWLGRIASPWPAKSRSTRAMSAVRNRANRGGRPKRRRSSPPRSRSVVEAVAGFGLA